MRDALGARRMSMFLVVLFLLLAACSPLSSSVLNPPTIDNFAATPTQVAVGEIVTFMWDVSSESANVRCELDVDGDAIADYTFESCAGNDHTQEHAYMSAGLFDATLLVSDAEQRSVSASIQVEVVPPGSELWLRQFGTSDTDYALNTAFDGTGNVLVTGYTDGSLEGSSAGDWDSFLTKYDRDGNALWTKQLGTSASDQSRAVAVDANDNVLVCGFTLGSLEGTNAGNADAFVRKYDSDGNVLWTRQFGTSEYDEAYEIAVDGNGNVLIVGSTHGSLEGINAAPGVSDVFVRKYDSDGNVLWTEQFGTSTFDRTQGVAVDGSGNVVVSGYTRGSLEGSSAGNADAFVRKYDSGGNALWTEQFGTSEDDFGSEVAVDGDGNVFISGYTRGSLEGSNAGNVDSFLRKYDSDGNVLWTEQFGTSGFDYVFGNEVDDNGDVLVVGSTDGDLAGANAGSFDVYVRKVESSGSLLWTNQFGTSEYDEAYGIAVDGNGNAVIAGFTDGSLEGSNAGSSDAFVRKNGP